MVPGAFSKLRTVDNIRVGKSVWGQNVMTLKIHLDPFCLYSPTQVEVENIYLCCFTSSGLWPDETVTLVHGVQRTKWGRKLHRELSLCQTTLDIPRVTLFFVCISSLEKIVVKST